MFRGITAMAKNRFSVDRLLRPLLLSFTAACILFGAPDNSIGARNETGGQSATSRKATSTDNKNAERWRKLPSNEKKELRNRMDQFRNLSPQQQEQYRRRYEKLQKMTPSQRKKVDRALEKGDTLPPTEKEEIRKLFEE